MIRATRYHDFSCGHRVCGHESKCVHLHGHNYRVTFEIEQIKNDTLDRVGRVLDFSVIKHELCDWLERHWDHRFLIWDKDLLAPILHDVDPLGVVLVPFNPTAENMALHLLNEVGPLCLADYPCFLVRVTVEETRKCAAIAEIER